MTVSEDEIDDGRGHDQAAIEAHTLAVEAEIQACEYIRWQLLMACLALTGGTDEKARAAHENLGRWLNRVALFDMRPERPGKLAWS